MGAANVTADTVFYPSNDPTIIRGRTNADNTDYFYLPYGQVVNCLVSSQDDDDIIVSADISSQKIVIGCVNDAGGSHGTDIDIVFKAIIKAQ